ncbi:MAG: type II secretion protein F, partial [Thermococci archaeon]|nr:type II secretion protein F [Thermococci archaeon]
PSILGIVAKLMKFMIQGAAAAEVPAMTTVVLLFVIVQGFISGLGIGVIREGKFSAGLKYSLLLAGMGFAIFKGMSMMSVGL